MILSAQDSIRGKHLRCLQGRWESNRLDSLGTWFTRAWLCFDWRSWRGWGGIRVHPRVSNGHEEEGFLCARSVQGMLQEKEGHILFVALPLCYANQRQGSSRARWFNWCMPQRILLYLKRSNSTMANRTRIVAAKFLTGGINGLSRQMLCWAHQCSSESDERTVMNDGQNTGNCGLATWHACAQAQQTSKGHALWCTSEGIGSYLKLGEEHQVNAILAAGDLFEVANPRKSLISDVARILHENNTVDVHIFMETTICAAMGVFGLSLNWQASATYTSMTHTMRLTRSFVLHPLPVQHKHGFEPFFFMPMMYRTWISLHPRMRWKQNFRLTPQMSKERVWSVHLRALAFVDGSSRQCVIPWYTRTDKIRWAWAGYVALVEIEKGKYHPSRRLKTGQLIWKGSTWCQEYTEDMLILGRFDSRRWLWFPTFDLNRRGWFDVLHGYNSSIWARRSPFGFLEIDVSGIRQTIDIAAIQEKISLPPMLNSVQEDILNEIDSTTDESRLTHLQAELVEFWRCLRDSGLMEEVN